MTTLTVLGEPFPDWESELQRAAAADLLAALASTAPRACSTRLLVAKGKPQPRFASPKAQVDSLPLAAGMLPVLWQSGASARPLDGELVHSLTPMMPLRSRPADDGTQTSVTVPHTLAWEAPHLLGSSQARLYRAFVRRAVKYADVLVTPTYAVASLLHEYYGDALPVQVVPLAPPTELLKPSDADERRTALGIPDHYMVTTASATEHGRLEWIFTAMRADRTIPHLVIVPGLDPTLAESARKMRAGAAAKSAQASTSATVDAASDAADANQTSAAPTSAASGTTSAGAVSGETTVGERASTAVDETPPPSETATGASRSSSTPVANPWSEVPADLRDRVTVITPGDLADIGATLSSAQLLLQPQSVAGSGYTLLAALAAGVPTLHSGAEAVAELILDGGVSAESETAFASELSRLAGDPAELDRLSVYAEDRSRTFSWVGTAWSLWELHANL
ncbi:hypothetical protein K8P10_000195 [Leucobacter sp. Psy1]|uniref:glycosyltransferase n=1 Tax=Leucobacter sp. Psy1 TaxID=2875729 RepID=UPI001CD6932F|nr:mannosyltransferase [Leucobacter sp. Psy1]UBH04684.1 hypothetical protein K8P10_000195 [Leucobacter sp. Psy1]